MTQTITLTQPQQRITNINTNYTTKQPVNQSKHVKRVPSVKPSFTVGDIRRAIPAECFKHSYVKSFSYLALDIVMSCILFYGSLHITYLPESTTLLGYILRSIAWTTYWITQGIVWTGIWVIGHECGHGGFSSSELVNDSVGMILHSFLMVPYFSWKISHRRHHSNTGNIDRDEVFVPDVADHLDDDDNYAADWFSQFKESINRAYCLLIMLTLGWPAYLIANVSSNKSYNPDKWINHFDPHSELFHMTTPELTKKQYSQIILSDIGLLINITIMSVLGYQYGFSNLSFYYIIPLMQNIMWLVIITFLQHTDHQLPHYDSSEWDWLRGALATIDRDYGILNFFHHHIGDTHIVHHMFHTMPFYNTQKATDAVKPLLQEYYVMDRTPIATALWNNYGTCSAVKPDSQQKGVYWF